MKEELTWKRTLRREPPSIYFFQNRNFFGFTLVELIVTTAIIGLLAALALPPALRARVQSNESAAVGNLRTVSSAAESYRTTQNPPAYAASLNTLATSVPPYLDNTWTGNQRQGYNFTYAVAGDLSTYSVSASPQIANISGINSYCIDQTGILRRYGAGGGAVGSQAGCDANGVPL